MSQREAFFSRQNLFAAGWAVVLGVAGYLAGLFSDQWRAPQEVVVTNHPVISTIETTAKLDPEAASELRTAVLALEEAMREQRQPQAPSAEDAALAAKISQLEAQIESLRSRTEAQRTAVVAEGNPPAAVALPPDGMASARLDRWPYAPYATVVRPDVSNDSEFELPSNVQGYTIKSPPSQLRDLSCPSNTRLARNSKVAFSFTVKDAKTLATISPLRIDSIQTDASGSLVSRFSRFVPIRIGGNEVELETNFDPGEHVLRLGYFRLSELDADFPTFFSLDCKFMALE